MVMDKSIEHTRVLTILESIEQNPDATQASLASQLGVAVGTINWHIKRMVEKGYVKVRRVERKKLRYIITPEGLALRAKLTIDYIQNSFKLYRLVRERSLQVLEMLRKKELKRIRLQGEGDVYDICKLTCLEQGFEIVDEPAAPLLKIVGLKVHLSNEDIWSGRNLLIDGESR